LAAERGTMVAFLKIASRKTTPGVARK